MDNTNDGNVRLRRDAEELKAFYLRLKTEYDEEFSELNRRFQSALESQKGRAISALGFSFENNKRLLNSMAQQVTDALAKLSELLTSIAQLQ